MKIALTSDLEQWIHDQVERGSYPSASDVLQDAVSLLREHARARQARLDDLRQQVAVGLAQLAHGESTPFDAECLQRIERRGRAKLEARPTARSAPGQMRNAQARKAKSHRTTTPV